MSAGDVAGAGAALGGRFQLVSYLPTYAATVFLLLLVWAGAPGRPPRFDRAWHTAAGLGLGEVVLVGLVVTLVALLLHPLQLRTVRLLEGDWPRPAAPLSRAACRRQERRRASLARAGALPTDPDPEQVARAAVAGTRYRRLFPGPSVPLRPTALGNALAAMEHRAGAEYGWDAVVAWPRLYPVLGAATRAVVDDRRDALDVASRLAVTAAVTAVVAAALLAWSGWWLLLALAPLGVAAVAYQGAVHAATAYGEAVRVAFDLHRFDLLDRLHLPLPADQGAERAACEALSLMWRQGAGEPLRYHHPDGTTGP